MAIPARTQFFGSGTCKTQTKLGLLVQFGFYLKNDQIEFKKKTKIGSNRLISVRFSYFITKTEMQPTNFGSIRFGFGSVILY
jgi:hypothetical protein